MNNWTWTEDTDEEFDKRMKTETRYRVFHKDGDEEIVDYRFWIKDDSSALCILKDFRKDHEGDGNEYLYSTSGYYIGPNKKKYDTMESMHKDWEKERYDEESRKYDIEKLTDFTYECSSEKRIETLERLESILKKTLSEIETYRKDSESLKNSISTADLKTDTEDVIDGMVMKSHSINDEYYHLRETEYLLRTKHNLSESWNLDSHILDDLRFNLKKMVEDGLYGYPSSYYSKAAESLGYETRENGLRLADETKNEEVEKIALEMWMGRLGELRTHVLYYLFFRDFGIVEEDDIELLEFSRMHENEIPYKEGTDKEIDYKKNSSLVQEHWNAIFDWLKEDGQNLWT